MRADDLIRTMDSFVGITEDPPGSNRTPIGAEFGYQGVPWCAETVSVACERNDFPLHEAAVIQIVNRAKSHWLGMSWSTVPVRGSAVCFDWKGNGNPNDMHTGLVYEVLGGGQFRTIEGNYRDRCDRWLRDMKYVNGFACFPFDEPTPIPAPEPVPIPKPKEGVMLDIVKADDKTAWYLTDWLSFRSWFVNQDEAAALIVQVVSGGGTIAHDGNNGPRIVSNPNLKRRLYSLPLVGPDEPPH